MTDEETLDVVRRLVAERGQVGAGKALGVARSLLSMVMSGSTPVSAKLRERVSAYLRQGAVDGVAYAEWQRLAWGGALLITLAVLLLNIVARTLFRQGKH